jgi:hypothetical protein
MFVGEKFYPWPRDFSDEAKVQGISKAIPSGSIPEYEPGETRIVFIHPKAIVKITTPGMGIFDLCRELVTEFIEEYKENNDGTDIDEYVAENMLWVDDDFITHHTLMVPQLLSDADRQKKLKPIEEKYGLVYEPAGFFGYSYMTGLQYVATAEETELPEYLRGLGIEAVHVIYKEDLEQEIQNG